MGSHAERHDWPRCCRNALSKKCYRIHKTGQNKNRRHKTRTRDLWNTRRENQMQTKLDQPPWKNRQHQTPETRPQLETLRKKRSWTPQQTMAMRRCRNRSNDIIHGGRWWWWYIYIYISGVSATCFVMLYHDKMLFARLFSLYYIHCWYACI